jgi:transcriptional regulator with XRE-family HTH domain
MEKKTLSLFIGKKILEFRKNKNLTQDELANRLKINRVSVINYEQGTQNPSLYLLYILSEIFDKTIIDFLPTNSEIKKMDKVDEVIKKYKISKIDLNKIIDNIK